MGSAGSHGIHLSPVRTTTYSTAKQYHGRRINRYAHPHNRVLPPPVAGQRLRSTDNGSILQEKGTIRGQRAGGSPLPVEEESEFLRVLQRRSERSLDGGKSTSIGSKWQSYSDPNITYSLQITDSNKKSKSSKKARAPPPPPSQDKKRNGKKMKNPAPPPPIVAVVHASPKRRTSPKLSNPKESFNILFPDSRPSESRHTILVKGDGSHKNESLRNSITESRIQMNEAFTEEIREATKRIAEKMGKVARKNSTKYDKNKNDISPKQYYFPDVEIKNKGKRGAVKVDESTSNNTKGADLVTSNRKPETKRDQIETNEQEKLQNRIFYQQSQTREWKSERNSVASSSCYSDSLPSLSGSDNDDINLKLRPTLPRRQLELPRFSPTEAWKFIGFPAKAMNKEFVPSSDEERMWRLNKLTSPKAAILERCEDSGISPDAESPVMTKDKYSIPNKPQHSFVIGQHSWIPQQDLLDDSDSNEFDDCIRNRRCIQVPVKLTLPNEMFCSKVNNFINKTVNHNDPEQRENRLRNRRNITKNTKHEGFGNLKKNSGMNGKSPCTEKLDSNWLLNQKNGKNYRFISNYNYVNSGGRKQLQSLIFGVKKEKQNEEQQDRSRCGEGGPRRKFSFYSTEGHVIYLPEYETFDIMRKQTKRREMERRHSSRRKKVSEKRANEIAEINRLEDDEWLLQMQKQHKRERDREKVNIKNKLKMCQMERHLTPRIFNEDDTHVKSLEDLSDRQDTSSPLLGEQWKSTPAELNSFHPAKIESSTSSPSSPEVAQSNVRKQYTGASKWMRRQRQPPPPQKRNFSPTRPEPEGGDGSSDENHQATDDTPTDNSQSPITRNPSVYTQLMEMAKEEEEKLKSKELLSEAQLKSSSRIEMSETEPKQKLDFEKEGSESSWKFKSVYPSNEVSNVKNVPNKLQEVIRPSVKTFYMELEERMKKITQQSQSKEKDGHKGNNVVKTILPNVVVNEGGMKSVIHLSSVQPFAPNKGYRPVPFKVPAVQKDGENKPAEITVQKTSLKT